MNFKYVVFSTVEKSDAIATARSMHKRTMLPLLKLIEECKTMRHLFTNKREAIRFAKNRGRNITSSKVVVSATGEVIASF